MSDGKVLAEYMKELATCVYNKLKRHGATCGLTDMISWDNGDHVEVEDHPDVFENFESVTIEQVEKYFVQNFNKSSGFEFRFNFDDDEIKEIFDGSVELRYRENGYIENENEQFVPTVYLGMPPTVKKTEKKSKIIKETKTSKITRLGEEESKDYMAMFVKPGEPGYRRRKTPKFWVDPDDELYLFVDLSKMDKEDFEPFSDYDLELMCDAIPIERDTRKRMIKRLNDRSKTLRIRIPNPLNGEDED